MPTTSKETADKKGKKPTLNPPLKVAGIGGTLDDLVINGKKWKAVVDNVVESASITRSVESSSVIELGVRDPNRKLLNHKILEDPDKRPGMAVDELHFVLDLLSKSGKTLSLTFADREICWLKELRGPKKAFRSKVTRAEFILSLIREVKHPIPIYIPELHAKQDVESSKEGAAAKKGKENTPGEVGLSKSDVGDITVKHDDASATQIHYIDEILSTGSSMGANFKVLVCSIMTATQETAIQNLDIGAAGQGLFSQEPGTWGKTYPGATRDPVTDSRGFFQVCIKEDRKNPNQSYADLCQSVQASANGSLYAAWEDEAKRTVEAYLGGTSTTGSGSRTIVEPYAFKVGKKENYWHAIQRLAEEVNWRAFFVGGVFFFLSEEELFRARTRLRISEDLPWVDNIDVSFDWSAEAQELSVDAHMQRWAAPPGTVVKVTGIGPASGKYLVSEIEGGLLPGDGGTCQVTLKKPMKAKKEPANDTRSVSTGGGSLGDAEGNATVERVLAFCEKEAKAKTPYAWGGFSSSGYDCSGFVSKALNVGGFLDGRLTTVTLATWGQAGEGELITVHDKAHTGNPHTEHVLIEVAGVIFECGGESGGVGKPSYSVSEIAEFSVKRHPEGY